MGKELAMQKERISLLRVFVPYMQPIIPITTCHGNYAEVCMR